MPLGCLAAVALLLLAPSPERPPHAPAAERAAPGGVTWVRIAGGTYAMGAHDDQSFDDEEPVHSVTVPAFELAKTEVTVAQYRACVAAGACTPPATDEGCPFGLAGRDEHPVTCVTWEQARAFARWVGGRLPSEAEWELAARSGGRAQVYPWGDAAPTSDLAVFGVHGVCPAEEPCGCGRNAAWPVCSKPAGSTPEGLCDMAGNVREWLEDVYVASYVGAPSDGTARTGAGPLRVLRGGSWRQESDCLRACHRSLEEAADRYDDVGFRPARAAR